MAQKWLLGKKAGRKNYERINDEYCLIHDVGFSGEKRYQVARIEVNSYGVEVPGTVDTQGGSFTRRADALKRIKELSLKYEKKNPMDASLVGAKIAKVIRDAKGKITGVVAHVMKKRNPVRKRNIAGFRDANGVFHPIRSGVRYGTSGGKRMQWQDVSPYDESVVTGAKVARKKKAAAKKKMSAAAAKRTPKAKKAAAAKKKAGARIRRK